METPKKLLDGILKKYGILNKVRGFYPIVDWKAIVGEELAKYTRPVRYDNETLIIEVSSSLFKRELENMKDELLAIISKRSLGFTPIKYLSFRVSSKVVHEKKPKEVKNSEDIEATLDQEDFKWIENEVKKFKGSESLKDSYRKLLTTFKLTEKKMILLNYRRCMKCGALFNGRGKLCPVCEIKDKRQPHT
ncbi:MAG: DUF721 domain-containing protein [Caldisericaceae bacterium]